MARRSFNLMRTAVIFAVVLVCSLLLPCFAFAAEVTADIFDLDSSANMAVVIQYEGAAPSVTFIRPNGRELDADDITVVGTKGTVTYYIPDAARGQWQIRYDKVSSSKIDISWAPYAEAIEITSLKYDRITSTDTKTEVSFNVKSNDNDRYNYAIYAAIVDENGNVTGTKRLDDGRTSPNEECRRTVRIDSLQPYHEYYMLLEVWREEYGVEVNDSMLSTGTFKIDGGNMHEAMENFRASVDCTAGILYLDWGGYTRWCDEYIVTVYNADDQTAPLYSVSLDDSVHTASAAFPKEASALIAELCYIDNGTASVSCVKNIPVNSGTTFTMPAESLTSSQQVTVGYSTDKEFSAQVTVNGTPQELNIKDSGSFSVSLQEFGNDIFLSYSLDDDHVVYNYSKSITLDTTAPVLTLPENDVTLYVQGTTFDIAGVAEAGAVVTVNGVAVTTAADGTFTHTVTLAQGENEFVVNACDEAGNASSQLFIINGIQEGAQVSAVATEEPAVWQKFLPLILAFVAGLAVLGAAVLLTKSHAKYAAVSSRYAVVATIRDALLICAAAAAVVTIYFAVCTALNAGSVNSDKIFETADKSISDAYNVIMKYHTAQSALVYGLVITGVLAVLFAAAFVAARLLKKRATEPPKEKKPKAPKPPKAPKAPKAPKEPKAKRTAPEKAAEFQPAPVMPEPAPVQQEQPTSDQTMFAEPVETAKVMFCPECGAKLLENAMFCDNCGHKLDQ